MNLLHRWICRSAYWRATVESRIVPWALEGVDLGSQVLEVGPGPGVTTDAIRSRVGRLTCVEIHQAMADALARRTAGQNVSVVCGDATALSVADATFDGAVSFTMLHHVPTMALQDRLLREVARVLRPGAIFAGTDIGWGRATRLVHLFDTMVLVDPRTFPARLHAAGFADVRVDVGARGFRFRARRQT